MKAYLLFALFFLTFDQNIAAESFVVVKNIQDYKKHITDLDDQNDKYIEQESLSFKSGYHPPWPSPPAKLETLNTLVIKSIQKKPGYDPKPHIIFFIHGLRGSESTFGYMHELLKKYLAPYKNIKVKILTYPTKEDPSDAKFFRVDQIQYLHPWDFAQIINTKIISYFFEQNLRDQNSCFKKYSTRPSPQLQFCLNNAVDLNTPYSLIMHSQGGLIGKILLNSCLPPNRGCEYESGLKEFEKLLLPEINNDNAQIKNKLTDLIYSHLEDHTIDGLSKTKALLPKNLRNFISLGSPFWGSYIANGSWFKEDFLNHAEEFLLNFKMSLPLNQIKQLSIGSKTLSWQRLFMLNIPWNRHELNKYRIWQSNYDKQLQVFNFAGDLSDFKDFFWFIDRPFKDFELDEVVALPEARSDFLYSIEDIHPDFGSIKGATFVSESQWQGTNFFPLRVAHQRLVHPITKKVIPGIAFIEHKNHLDHPSFIGIRNIFYQQFGLLNKGKLYTPEQMQKWFTEDIQNFTVELKLVFPEGYHRQMAIQENKIHIYSQDSSLFEILDLKQRAHSISLGNPSGVNNEGLKATGRYQQTFYHVGRFNKSQAWKPHKVPLSMMKISELSYQIPILGFTRRPFAQNKEREFSIPVLPSYNSYGELYFYPYLPFPPQSGLDQVLNSIKIQHDLFKNIKINNQGLIEQTWSQVPQPNTPGCRLGIVGKTTPLTFLNTNFDPSGNLQSDQLHHYQKWRQYAANQNLIFTTWNASTYFENDPFYVPERSLKAGEVVEVLARVTKGWVDPHSGIARKCTPTEARRFSICDTPPIDRYLITSPALRHLDETRSDRRVNFYDLATSKDEPSMLGLRWINVTDVDIVGPEFPLPITRLQKTARPISFSSDEDNCLKDQLSYQYRYLNVEETLKEYY